MLLNLRKSQKLCDIIKYLSSERRTQTQRQHVSTYSLPPRTDHHVCDENSLTGTITPSTGNYYRIHTLRGRFTLISNIGYMSFSHLLLLVVSYADSDMHIQFCFKTVVPVMPPTEMRVASQRPLPLTP